MLLSADQEPDNYWITVQQQYRTGGPNGYAILHYEGAPNYTLPDTNASQPGAVKPFTLAQINSVRLRPAIRAYLVVQPCRMCFVLGRRLLCLMIHLPE